jgi:hypothetical protein
MGPVHAQVALVGQRAAVTVWAERPAAVERLRAHQASLTEALAGADFIPKVSLYAGAPPRPAPQAGRFLDQAS